MAWWGVRMGMQGHVLVHASLEEAKYKTQRVTWSGVAVLSLTRWGGVDVYFPNHAVFCSWTVSMRLWFGLNKAYCASATQGHLHKKDARAEGLMVRQRWTIHGNP